MMKKFLMAAMFCMALISGSAQETKWGGGINIGYGTDVSKPFLGAKAHYDITDAFTVAASFNHYFKETVDLGEFGATGVEGKLKCWDINADFHWNVFRNEIFKFYPLVGLTYLHLKGSTEVAGASISNSDGKFGANLGIGGQLNLGSNWAVGVEAKYQIVDGGQFVPMASAMYRF